MRCPGCSKHCCENAPRCKYGRSYFAKQQEKQEEKTKVKYKWERKVTNGGLIWRLLSVNRRVKKAVCREDISEEELLCVLTDGEQEALYAILSKLEKTLHFEKR